MTVPVDPERFIAGGYLPASFLDWDGHVAAVVFTRGCNFRCPWCHNSELVLGKSEKLDLVRITDAGEKNSLTGSSLQEGSLHFGADSSILFGK